MAIQRNKSGRRYEDSLDETGVTVRVFAPKGSDGESGDERDEFPFSGQFYATTMADTPRTRWYTLEHVGSTPAGIIVYAWERCDPPPGHIGRPAQDPEETQPVELYDEAEGDDTTPCFTLPV